MNSCLWVLFRPLKVVSQKRALIRRTISLTRVIWKAIRNLFLAQTKLVLRKKASTAFCQSMRSHGFNQNRFLLFVSWKSLNDFIHDIYISMKVTVMMIVLLLDFILAWNRAYTISLFCSLHCTCVIFSRSISLLQLSKEMQSSYSAFVPARWRFRATLRDKEIAHLKQKEFLLCWAMKEAR